MVVKPSLAHSVMRRSHWGNGPHLACQADLAHHGDVRADSLVPQAGSDGRAESQIGRRFGKFQAAGHIDIHILIIGPHVGSFVKDCQQHRNPAAVCPVYGAAGSHGERFAGQGLNVA